MNTDDLGTIYESSVFNEGLVSNVGKILKTGLEQGSNIFDIVSNNLQEFISVIAVVSAMTTAMKFQTMYQNRPDILKSHIHHVEAAKDEVAQFLVDHPDIVQMLIKKS